MYQETLCCSTNLQRGPDILIRSGHRFSLVLAQTSIESNQSVWEKWKPIRFSYLCSLVRFLAVWFGFVGQFGLALEGKKS